MFEQTAVFERGVGEVTDIVEKELFRIAPRTEEADRGRSGRSRPRDRAAYVQHGMQTLPQPVKVDDRADVPLRPPAGRVATASSGSSTSRRSATAVRPSTPRSSSSGRGSTPRRPDRGRGPAQLRSATRPAARRTWPSSPTTTAGHADDLPPTERDRLERNVLACSTRRTRRWRSSMPARRGSPTACARRARSISRASGRTSMRWACRTAWTGARSRARLLHPHGVRVLRLGPRGPAAGAGWRWPLRRPGGAARWAPTPGIGFGIGLDRLLLALAEQGVDRGPGTAVACRRRRPRRHGRPAADRDRPASGGRTAAPSSAGASSGNSSRRRPGRRPLRRDPRRRAGRRSRPAPRSAGGDAAGRGARGPRP